MPSQLVRNIQSGLSLAQGFNQIQQQDLELEERRRKAEERQQMEGALASLRETGELPEGIYETVGLEAQTKHRAGIQEGIVHRRAVEKDQIDKEAEEILQTQILPNLNPQSPDDILGAMDSMNPPEGVSWSVWQEVAFKLNSFVKSDEQIYSDIKKHKFLNATKEMSQLDMVLHEADNLVRNGRNNEAYEMLGEAINHSRNPYSVQHLGNGRYSLRFNTPADTGEPEMIAEDISYDDLQDELRNLTAQQNFYLRESYEEAATKHNEHIKDNPVHLFDKRGRQYKIYAYTSAFDGNDIVIETPNGQRIKNTEGESLSFKKPHEAAEYLKQHIGDMWDDAGNVVRFHDIITKQDTNARAWTKHHMEMTGEGKKAGEAMSPSDAKNIQDLLYGHGENPGMFHNLGIEDKEIQDQINRNLGGIYEQQGKDTNPINAIYQAIDMLPEGAQKKGILSRLKDWIGGKGGDDTSPSAVKEAGGDFVSILAQQAGVTPQAQAQPQVPPGIAKPTPQATPQEEAPPAPVWHRYENVEVKENGAIWGTDEEGNYRRLKDVPRSRGLGGAALTYTLKDPSSGKDVAVFTREAEEYLLQMRDHNLLSELPKKMKEEILKGELGPKERKFIEEHFGTVEAFKKLIGN